jgi:peptide/nickel transport system permease protein
VIRYIVRRLLASIPVLFGIVLLVFLLARAIPGEPCTATYGEKATPAVCAAFAQRYGLDKAIVPFLYKDREGWSFSPDPSTIVDNQFVVYAGRLLQGDFGSSIRFGRPVTAILVERLPTTVELTLTALIFASVVGVTLGLISATRRNSPVDVGTMVVANLGVSTPVFVLGLILAYIFAVVLRDTPLALPPSGRISAGTHIVPLAQAWGLQGLGGPLRSILDFVSNMYILNSLLRADWGSLGDALRHMILPAVAVGTIPLAIIARMTRSALLEVLGLDYIRTARAKGLRERLVVLRHGMRNALLPVVTVIGLSIGGFLSGAVLTETIFNLTGIGKTLFEAIQGRDYIVVQGVTVIVAIGYLLVNLVVDVSYAFLDPRIRLT